MDFFSFVKSVPDVVWSGLLASLFTSALTLGGVWLSNRSSATRLEIQLKHESHTKAQERTASLRKEVYLEVAKKMPKALGSLVDITNTDEAIKFSDDLNDFFYVAAQVQLVAEPATASLVSDLVRKYNSVLMTSALGRDALKDAVRETSSLTEKRDFLLSESERLSLEVENLSGAVPSGSKISPALVTSCLSCSVKLKEAKLELAESQRNVILERFSLLKILLPDIKNIARMQVGVLVGIRSDLGLTSNVDLLNEQANKQLDDIEGVIKYLDDLIKEGGLDKAKS